MTDPSQRGPDAEGEFSSPHTTRAHPPLSEARLCLHTGPSPVRAAAAPVAARCRSCCRRSWLLPLLRVCGTMRALAHAYMRSLDRRPVLTKSSTAFVAFSITDGLAQKRERQPRWDPVRTVRGGLYGLLYHGPFVHTLWGKQWGLERLLPGPSWPMVIGRVAGDQLALLPVNMLVFCAWPALLTRGPTQEGLAEAAAAVRNGWWEACTFGGSIWPFVHLINFRFVPLELRVLVLNTCSIGVFSYATLVRDGGAPLPTSEALVRTLTGSLPAGMEREPERSRRAEPGVDQSDACGDGASGPRVNGR